jgi:hypothetical protein
VARAKPGQMQMRHTLLDAEGLSSRVNPNKESIQYEFMKRVISFVNMEVGKNKNKMTSHCFSWHARLQLLCS